eukprot:9624093-Heterocapsa_arctica.AAC.1
MTSSGKRSMQDFTCGTSRRTRSPSSTSRSNTLTAGQAAARRPWRWAPACRPVATSAAAHR